MDDAVSLIVRTSELPGVHSYAHLLSNANVVAVRMCFFTLTHLVYTRSSVCAVRPTGLPLCCRHMA